MGLQERWKTARQTPFTDDLAFVVAFILAPLVAYALLLYWRWPTWQAAAIGGAVSIVLFIVWFIVPHAPQKSDQLLVKGWQRPAALLAGMALVGIVWGTQVVLDWINAGTPADRTDVIKTVAQVIGGAALLVGLYFTYRTVKASQATLNLAIEKQVLEQNTLDLTRAGQVADRFTKAVEQLGSPNESVRIGGLYSLQLLARDHEDFYDQVIDVVCSFIRHRSQDPNVLALATAYPVRPAMDIEAAMLVLQNRRHRYGRGEQRGLNLRGAMLVGIQLRDADFQRADFSGSNLQNLRSTNTNFAFANFAGAVLSISEHQNPILIAADFADARVFGATFEFSSWVENPRPRVEKESLAEQNAFPASLFFPRVFNSEQKFVPGGWYLDGSRWLFASSVELCTFGQLRELFTSDSRPAQETRLDLSGMGVLTAAQFKSMHVPKDAILPSIRGNGEEEHPADQVPVSPRPKAKSGWSWRHLFVARRKEQGGD